MTIIEWKKTEKTIPYEQAISAMEERVNGIIDQTKQELIWFLEHDEVYTAGTSAQDKELLSPKFQIYQTGRGGKYTYHGPGQRVVYFMLNLKKLFVELNLRKYIYLLEEIVIRTLEDLDIPAFRCPERIGIWVISKGKEKKIAAIGVRVRKWISYHGIAINVNPDLNNYSGIIPCGISEYGVTSLEDLGVKCDLNLLDQVLQRNIKKIFLIE